MQNKSLYVPNAGSFERTDRPLAIVTGDDHSCVFIAAYCVQNNIGHTYLNCG